MDLEEGEIAISDTECDHVIHDESTVGRGIIIERQIHASKYISTKSSKGHKSYPRNKFIKIRDESSTRRSTRPSISRCRSTVQQRSWKEYNGMDFNKETNLSASVATSVCETFNFKSAKKNPLLKRSTSSNLIKIKSSNHNKKEMKKHHKGSHNNHLLKKVISKSGPNSVFLEVSHKSQSLMSKLISAGLAKKSSDIVDPEMSESRSQIRHCYSKDEKECETDRKTEDDEDSEIEIIIPPKKEHTVVTLDSDGEEVTHQLSGVKLSKNVEDSVMVTQFDNTQKSKHTSSLYNSGISKNKDLDCYDNLSSRSDATPLCYSASEDDSTSLPFTPSSPSSCNSIELSFKQVEETLYKLKEQIEIETANKVLPDIKNQVGTSQCLEIGSGVSEPNQIRVVSQNVGTSYKDSHVNLSVSSCQKEMTNSGPILDSSHNSSSSTSYTRKQRSKNKTFCELQSSNIKNPSKTYFKTTLDSINSTTKNRATNEASLSTDKESNVDNLYSSPACIVVGNEKAHTLISGNLNSPISESVSPTNLSFHLGKQSKDMQLVSDYSEILIPHDCQISKAVSIKGMGVSNLPQESNFAEHRKECNDKQELDYSNTLAYDKNLEQEISNFSANIIDTTSSFLCSSIKQTIPEYLGTGNSSCNTDCVGSSDGSCIQLKDISSHSKSCVSSILDVESGQCVNVEQKQYTEEKGKEKVDSDDDDLSKLRSLALSSKGKPGQSLPHKDDNASSLENVSQTNTTADDENYDNEEEDILLLRVAALKSAVIKKHEQRKKKGLLVKKNNRVSIDLGSISDETFSLSKESSVEKDSVCNIAKTLQNDDLNPESPAETLQGEEDMEISDSGDASDNQENLINNIPESLETENIKNTTLVSHLASFDSEHDNIFTSIVPTTPKTQPLGVTESIKYSSGCFSDSFKNYSQSIPAVLPPPPPPPALIFNSLLSPPPPPPLPECEEQLKTFHTPKVHQIELNQNYGSFQEPDKCLSNDFAISEYSCENTVKVIPSENNIYECVDPLQEVHGLQTIETTFAVIESPKKRNVNKFKSSAIDPLRRNLRKIPLAKKDQIKMSKNKWQRQKRQTMKGTASQAETAHEYIESNSAIVSSTSTKNGSPLCITNTPIQQSIYLDISKHNFPLCTTDISLLKSKKNPTVDLNPSSLMCTEDPSLRGNSTPTTNKHTDKFTNQHSYSPNNKKNDWESEVDGTILVKFQDEEMDLSNMIVIDEVGMSPEHKSSYDQQCDYGLEKKTIDDAEDSLRVCSLTSLSSKHGLSKSFRSFSPQSRPIPDSCNKFSVASGISKTHKHEPVTERDQATIGKRDFKNFSITKKVNDCDASIYKLTRVVTKEPHRSVVKGKETLKVVIPTDTPPILNSPQPFSAPVIERFVISVGKDSDSEEEGEWSRKVKIQETPFMSTSVEFGRDYELERSVDLLLSSTRQKIERAVPVQTKPVLSRININKNLTPVPKKNPFDDSSDTPMHLLPKERQEEYMRLKKIIDDKERQKQQSQKCLTNRHRHKETLSSTTNKLNTTKDRQTKKTSLSSLVAEGKDVIVRRNNHNVCIQKDKTCKEGGGALLPRDTIHHTKSSRIQLPPKEERKYRSEVKDVLAVSIETNNVLPQHFEIISGLTINDCKNKGESNQKSNGNKCVVDEVCEKSACKNMESDMKNLSSSEHIEGISKNATPDKACAQKVLTKNISESVQPLSEVCLVNSQKSLEKQMTDLNLNTSTIEPLQNSLMCRNQQSKASAQNNSLCLVSEKVQHHKISFLGSSNNTSLENTSLSEEITPVSQFGENSMEDVKLKPLPQHLVSTQSTKSSSDADLLFSKQEELLTERFALMDELSEMSESMGKLEQELAREGSLVADIERLRCKLLEAERQLQEQNILTTELEQRVQNAHQAACNRHTLVFSLETSCQQLGTRLRGPTYLTPVRGKELLEKKMKQVFEKRKNVVTKRESYKSDFQSIISEKNDFQAHDLSSILKHDSTLFMEKVDQQPNILVPENSGSNTEHLGKSSLTGDSSVSTDLTQLECPEIISSRVAYLKSTACETNSSKSIISTLSSPVEHVSQSHRERSESHIETKKTKDDSCLKSKNVQEMSVKRPILSIDSTSIDKTCCKKLCFEKKQDKDHDTNDQPNSNHESSGDEKTVDLTMLKNRSCSNKTRTSKLHYKSVLQFSSKNTKRNNTSELLPSSRSVLCPYDLMGQCQDSQCRYEHLPS